MLLSVHHLEVCYGVISALQDVSLEINRGEIVALIGSNGAGKTTLLRTISGLLRPREGRIAFADADLTRLPPHAITARGIAHVPEGRKLFSRLTIRQNLLVGAYTKGARTREQEAMERVFTIFPRLRERADQRAGTLSGGEQQMVAIGRALMARPKLLLLDEPSMGLAPIFVEKIFEIVREINQQGTPILLVEQNALMALDVAKRGYVMETGRIELTDDAKALSKNEQVQKAYLGIT